MEYAPLDPTAKILLMYLTNPGILQPVAAGRAISARPSPWRWEMFTALASLVVQEGDDGSMQCKQRLNERLSTNSD